MTDTTNQDDVIDVFADREPSGVETDQEQNGIDDQPEDEAEDSDEDNGSPSDDDEYEEVERGDKRYKVHKDLKGDLLRQDDYTRKSQVHAEAVRRFEDRVKAFDLASDESLSAAVEAKALKDRLSDLQSLTEDQWFWLRQNKPNEYDKFTREMVTLPQKVAEAESKSKAKRDEVLRAQSEVQTKRIEQGQAILARDIPGWGPELGNKLVEFATKRFGASAEEDSEAFMNPKVVKMVHALWQAEQNQRKTQTQQRAEQVQKQVPPPTVKAGAAPKAGLHEGLSAKEWADRRNKQLAAKGR